MMLPFRCPHLFAKPLCIPQAPAITHIGLCSIALHTFYWVNTGPFLSVHRRGPMLYKSVNAILPLYLGDFFASSPNVTPHLVVFFVVVWKSGLMTDFISQNLLPIVYIAVQSQWPHLHLGWMGSPTLTQFNNKKKIMRPLKAHRCVSTMKRVYNQCKCEVFLLCGALRFDTHLFCWIKSASLFALRI